VPGIFFDINPEHRRDLFESPCHHFVRISFGPPLEVLDKGSPILRVRHQRMVLILFYPGLDAIQRVLDHANTHGMRAFGHSYKKSKEINIAQHGVHAL